MTIKRGLAVFFVAAMLAVVAFGCSGDAQPGDVQLTDPPDMTTTTTTTTESYTEDDYTNGEENGDETGETTTAANGTTAPGQTTPATTTTGAGGQTAAPTTTTSTTRTTTTQNQTPAPPPGGGAQQILTTPIRINNNTEALAQFNSTINRVTSQRAGFNKRHAATNVNFQAGADLANINIPFLNNAETWIRTLIQTVMGGAPTASRQERGRESVLIQNNQLSLNNGLSGISYTQQANGNWVITLNVSNATTTWRQGGATTGTPHMQRGPIRQVTDADFGTGFTGVVHDHMCASRANSFLGNTLQLDLGGVATLPTMITPTEITENTTNGRYVLTLDRNGNPISLVASYNQTINMVEATILTQTTRNNRITSTVTITYYNFLFR